MCHSDVSELVLLGVLAVHAALVIVLKKAGGVGAGAVASEIVLGISGAGAASPRSGMKWCSRPARSDLPVPADVHETQPSGSNDAMVGSGSGAGADCSTEATVLFAVSAWTWWRNRSGRARAVVGPKLADSDAEATVALTSGGVQTPAFRITLGGLVV